MRNLPKVFLRSYNNVAPDSVVCRDRVAAVIFEEVAIQHCIPEDEQSNPVTGRQMVNRRFRQKTTEMRPRANVNCISDSLRLAGYLGQHGRNVRLHTFGAHKHNHHVTIVTSSVHIPKHHGTHPGFPLFYRPKISRTFPWPPWKIFQDLFGAREWRKKHKRH